jgi:hypothetical protein
LNKVVIGDQEFLLANQPFRQFSQVYGASNFLTRLLSLRFESFDDKQVPVHATGRLPVILAEFIPLRLGFRPLYVYNLIYLEYANSYKTYRHLFNLPVNGQRTWGGGRSIKNLKSQLFNYKLKKFNKQWGMPVSYFMPEMVNLLWKQQWRHEWEVSKKYRERLPWYVQRKKK